MGYGERISTRFSYGVSLKGVRESIDGNTASGVMMSAGGLYYSARSGLSWGFGVFNVGPQVKGYSLPSGGYLGFSAAKSTYLKWTGEADAYVDGSLDAYTGVEYNIKNIFSIRGGYRFPFRDDKLGNQPTINFSGGIGFVIKGVEFDYAWVPYGDLGDTHRISLTTRFGPKKEDDR